MRSFIISLFFIVFLVPATTSAQGPVKDYATYTVTNFHEPIATETWQIERFVSQDGYYPSYVTRKIKNTPGQPEKAMLETESYEGRTINYGFVFLSFFWEKHPADFEKDGSTFGRVEVRKEKTDPILDTWPLFVSVKRFTLYLETTMTMFPPDGKVFVVKEMSNNLSYHTPFLKIEQFFSREGKLLNEITYTKQDSKSSLR
jgi:hypothetical protein